MQDRETQSFKRAVFNKLVAPWREVRIRRKSSRLGNQIFHEEQNGHLTHKTALQLLGRVTARGADPEKVSARYFKEQSRVLARNLHEQSSLEIISWRFLQTTDNEAYHNLQKSKKESVVDNQDPF